MSKEHTKSKLWSGRFTETTERQVELFTASLEYDRRFYAEDIEASTAHVKVLLKAQVLTEQEAESLIAGLAQIKKEITEGRFNYDTSLEDIHMNIEACLIERLGDVGKKLHTGRSRNDQVATDFRLYLRGQIDLLLEKIHQLQRGLLELAEREAETVMPAYTHLQVAQPISFGHHLLAWFEMLKRDVARLKDTRKRVNVLPLGSAACAGTVYDLDRRYAAELLGFDAISDNSLDAVSDRDFAVEFCSCCALLLSHLSRVCEELVLWSSQQFDFVTLAERFCTGSSIMPQKKNPDVAELIRGKSSRTSGALVALLMLMKGQPLAYNRDNQEDKAIVYEALDATLPSVVILAELIPTIKANRAKMLEAAQSGFSTATDLADYLVGKKVPFRDAHRIVGQAVKLAVQQDCALDALPIEQLQALHPTLDSSALKVLNPKTAIQNKRTHGGTAGVRQRIADARAYLDV
ncbi:MAG: argininosuccinate lyase [Chromatiales bacterium]|nr:argininosuccinate lyase [Chromatiales bacterium]